MSVKGALRQLKNSVMSYDEAEIRVREATSNDNWGASSTLMHEIAEDTRHRFKYQSTLGMINKRLIDYQHLNHVLKSLILIEFLLKNGDSKFIQDMQDRKLIIKRLKGYKYYKDTKELGGNVRKWASRVMALLENETDLKKERESAKKTKGKIKGISNETIRSERFDKDSDRNYFSEDSSVSPVKERPEKQTETVNNDDSESEVKPKTKKKGTKKKKKQKKASSDDDEPAEASGGEDEGVQVENDQKDDFFDTEFNFDEKNTTKKKKKKKKGQSVDNDVKEESTVVNFGFDDSGTGDFSFDFSSEPQKPKSTKAGADDDWMFAVGEVGGSAHQMTEVFSDAIVENNSKSGDGFALFDVAVIEEKPMEKRPTSPTTDIWGELTNLNLNGGDPPKKSNAQPKQGTSMKEMSGPIDPFSFAPTPMMPQPAGNNMMGMGMNMGMPQQHPYGMGMGAMGMAPMNQPNMNPFGAPMMGGYGNYGQAPMPANPFGNMGMSGFAQPQQPAKPAQQKNVLDEFTW